MHLKFITIIGFLAFKNIEAAQDLPQYFTRLELRALEYLKDFVCGFTTNSVDESKFDPFFCVQNDKCNETQPVNMTAPLARCDVRLYNYQQIRCCHMKDILNGTKPLFNSDKKYWGVVRPRNVSIEDYSQELYNTHFDDKKRHILGSNELCGLQPTFHTNSSGAKEPRYIPFLCKETPCDQDLAPSVATFFSSNPTVPQFFPKGEIFCTAWTGPGYCCHPWTFFDEDSASDISDDSVFKVRTLNNIQNGAIGFKSSFQCEQYSRLHCEGDYDRCSLRVLDRDTAVPGEFPHQALLGIQGPSYRHFHCSGTLVSRYYILSAFLCKYHDRVITSVALLGEYDTYDSREFGEKEYLAYLDRVYVEPDFDNPNFPKYKIAKKMKMALFKMWRQVKFHYWVKPACLNWKIFFKEREDSKNRKTITAVYPNETYFTGFGSTDETGGRKNKTLKRILFQTNPCDKNPTTCPSCQTAFFNTSSSPTRPIWIRDNQFCQVGDRETSGSVLPCEFDLGSSAVLLSTENVNQTPYCQWRVFGVNVDPRRDCSSRNPSLYRIIGNQLLAWLEDVVWYDDFQLPMFDLRWPSCYDPYTYKHMQNFIHLDNEYYKFYADDPSQTYL